jgi:hypothetical protein
LSIASNIQWYALIPHKAYSFITTLFLGPFDDVITKFYCIYLFIYFSMVYLTKLPVSKMRRMMVNDRMIMNNVLEMIRKKTVVA